MRLAFWSRNRWFEFGKEPAGDRPVHPWDEKKIESAGYRLSVGAEYFVNGDGTSTVKKLDDGEAFVIGPGEFAFILTKEKVIIPKGAIGFISIRASIKFRGLVNVSGFQVNPGFRGNLVFAVFNAGPRHVNLRTGDDIFSLWIADLDSPVDVEYEDYGKIPNDLKVIPSDFINGIAGKALTAYQLSEQISELKDNISSVRIKLYTTWAIAGIIYILVLNFFGAPVPP